MPVHDTTIVRRRAQTSAAIEKKAEIRDKRSKKLFVLLFMLMCAVGTFVISQVFLIHNSIRLDESQSLWQTSHSLAGTLKVVASDVHVPLYHLILHFWQLYIGPGVESARYLSYIFFVATIPFVYLLARKILSMRWALFVVFLFSFSPFMNWYANEARMYTLLALMATASSYYFMTLIESKGKKGWLGYSLSAMIGVYSHYFFMFTLIAQAIFFIINRKKFVKGTFRKFIFLASFLLLELSPWFLYFRSLGSASNTSPDLQLPSTVDFFNVFSQFSFGFQTDAMNTILVSTWPIVVVVSLLGVKYGQRLTTKAGYILAAAFLPVFLAFVISYLVTPFFLSRYMTAAIVPLTIVVVWFVSHYQKRLALTISALIIVVTGVFSYQQYMSVDTPVKEDYRAAAEYFTENAKAHDVIVLSAPFTVYPIGYYYKGSTAIQTLPIWNRSIPGSLPTFDKAKLPEQVKSLNKNHQYAYVLLSFDQGYEDDIFQYYQQNFEQVSAKQLSPDLNLYVYRVGYDKLTPLGKE